MVNSDQLERRNSRPIFVDSCAWIALFKKDDDHHQKARTIFHSQIPEDIPLITSNVVLYEVLTVLSMRASKDIANVFGSWFYNKALRRELVQYIFVDEAIENKTWILFKKVSGKNVSFVDCTSVIIASENDVKEIVTFDRHFKQFEHEFDLTVLN